MVHCMPLLHPAIKAHEYNTCPHDLPSLGPQTAIHITENWHCGICLTASSSWVFIWHRLGKRKKKEFSGSLKWSQRHSQNAFPSNQEVILLCHWELLPISSLDFFCWKSSKLTWVALLVVAGSMHLYLSLSWVMTTTELSSVNDSCKKGFQNSLRQSDHQCQMDRLQLPHYCHY